MQMGFSLLRRKHTHRVMFASDELVKGFLFFLSLALKQIILSNLINIISSFSRFLLENAHTFI